MVKMDKYATDIVFHLKRRDNKRILSKTVMNVGDSLFSSGRPLDIYLDIEDINKLISALQTLKEDAGYTLEA